MRPKEETGKAGPPPVAAFVPSKKLARKFIKAIAAFGTKSGMSTNQMIARFAL
jgi:hypothetical protein